jgi:spermidine synthase
VLHNSLKELSGASKHLATQMRIVVWIVLGMILVYIALRRPFKRVQSSKFLVCLWLTLGVLGMGGYIWMQLRNPDSERILRSRSFYGVLSVFDHQRDQPEERYFLLQHGRITHGLQFASAEKASLPTTYYSEESGVGRAVRALPETNRKIGLVGLGTGTMAAYARPGDYLRIYEINPEVARIANSRFSYLRRCLGNVEIALGDARLSMEKERSQEFDLLVLDAFSSDAIPVHLLTKEAFELYRRELKPNGIIAVHISNHYLDLEPVVANAAKEFGYHSALVEVEENDEEWWIYGSTWVLLSKDQALIQSPIIQPGASQLKPAKNIPLWTDDFTSVYQRLK